VLVKYLQLVGSDSDSVGIDGLLEGAEMLVIVFVLPIRDSLVAAHPAVVAFVGVVVGAVAAAAEFVQSSRAVVDTPVAAGGGVAVAIAYASVFVLPVVVAVVVVAAVVVAAVVDAAVVVAAVVAEVAEAIVADRIPVFAFVPQLVDCAVVNVVNVVLVYSAVENVVSVGVVSDSVAVVVAAAFFLISLALVVFVVALVDQVS